MSPYEAGFAAGERDAFYDRRAGKPKLMPPDVRGYYSAGYWDAYRPRTEEWRIGTRVTVSAWWIETEKEEA
jgi:hypothetical protein